MLQTILLIDFENVRNVALESLPTDYRVLIFVGRSQHSIPFELTRQAQQLGNRLEWIKIEGDGHNNLDFHLAYYLGRFAADKSKAKYLILSKDKGFDNLIKHVVAEGLHCRRIETVPNLGKAIGPAATDAHYDKVFKVLDGIAGNARPRKRKTLVAHVASIYQNEPATEIERIVELLFSKKLIAESGNTLTYNF